MSGIQSKNTRHAKDQENTIQNEKKQWTLCLKLTHLKEFVDIDIKNCYYNWISYVQKLEERLNLDIEDTKKQTQVEILEMKTRMSAIKKK